jgi:hypothetical protein
MLNHEKDVPQKIRRQSSGVPPGSLIVPTTAQSNKLSDMGLNCTPSSLVPSSSTPASARTSIAGDLNSLPDIKLHSGIIFFFHSILNIFFTMIFI